MCNLLLSERTKNKLGARRTDNGYDFKYTKRVLVTIWVKFSLKELLPAVNHHTPSSRFINIDSELMLLERTNSFKNNKRTPWPKVHAMGVRFNRMTCNMKETTSDDLPSCTNWYDNLVGNYKFSLRFHAIGI